MSKNIAQKRKQFFPINDSFREYLSGHGRYMELPVIYEDLLGYEDSFPLINEFGEDTLWQTLLFEQQRGKELYEGLKQIYVQLRSEGQKSVLKNLYIDRVDLCTFGNTRPMRVRVVNQFNDNHDYFYIKKADASRVYGLEIEELLSPNDINFLIWKDTLIEEHIIGVPGDQFIKHYLPRPDIHEVRLAKEFIKFNERSFVRLLGDMRAYNYVVEVTPILKKANTVFVRLILTNNATKVNAPCICPNIFNIYSNFTILEIWVNNNFIFRNKTTCPVVVPTMHSFD